MNPDTRSTLNQSCGWTIAVWLLLAAFSEGWMPVTALVGAVVTVLIWAVLTRYLEEGGG